MTAQDAKPNIRFGTDGWRALIAEDYTFGNVRACAQAVALEMAASGDAARGVVAGFDTRFLSDRFAAAAAEVLAANGLDTHLSDRPAPTPACSYAVTHLGAGAGVMITASHNPAIWNGFKVKSSVGGSAPPEMVARIESHVDAVLLGDKPIKRGGAGSGVRSFDPVQPYAEQLGRVMDIAPVREKRLKVVVDAMYGSGAGILPKVLSGGNVEVIEINGEFNPAFPGIRQPEPVESNLKRLADEVKRSGADVGLALDGDADRLGVIDETGHYMSTLEVFSLLAHHLVARRKLTGGVACTITMSSMVDRLGEAYNIPVFRTPVGFKFVGPTMVDEGCVIGGEESGGYAFQGHIPERDGSLSGLLFLEAMVMSGKKPSELLGELHDLAGPHTFRRIDLEFDDSRRGAIQDALASSEPDKIGGMAVESADRRDGVRFNLAGGSWTVARLSGTEPLVRLYAETPDDKSLEAVLKGLRELLGV
ncbi:MAG: phosphoglucomutase/phosphomannomutase family protein [Dehalococcoidia bacterium]